MSTGSSIHLGKRDPSPMYMYIIWHMYMYLHLTTFSSRSSYWKLYYYMYTDSTCVHELHVYREEPTWYSYKMCCSVHVQRYGTDNGNCQTGTLQGCRCKPELLINPKTCCCRAAPVRQRCPGLAWLLPGWALPWQWQC